MAYRFFIDAALRKSGVVIFNENTIVDLLVFKYKPEFSGLDFFTIDKHKSFLIEEFSKLRDKYKIKRVDLAYIEADVFGFRKGGFKNKEIMTIIRLNYAFALQKVFSINSKSIKFIPANIWKRALLGNSHLQKSKYRTFVLEKIQEITKSRVDRNISHDIVDALAIFLYYHKISCPDCETDLSFFENIDVE